MSAQNEREGAWLRSLREAPRAPGNWPRLVLWDFLGACVLAVGAAILVVLVGV